MDNNREVLTVTQINEYIKALFDYDEFLASVYVKGEISNFTNHYKTGHFYFTVKDEGGVLRAVMFKGSALKLKFLPENGMKVILHGRIASYVRDGQYQMYVDEMTEDGIGSLYVAFEQLKRRLEAEGLFAEARKKPLPKIPSKIGVITSPTGAAIRDIINILGRRFPYAKVTLYPTLVQGADAALQLVSAVKHFNDNSSVDVIIIGRGGGSIEDLWAFNDETLARTVAASGIPVISAVGHETDFTICDFVADKRAPTPSAAAELAVPETGELMRKVSNIVGKMELVLEKNLDRSKERLNALATRPIMTSPHRYIEERYMELASRYERLEVLIEQRQTQKRSKLAESASKLEALSPLAVLGRGYSVAFGDDGTLLKSTKQIKADDRFTLNLSDGAILAVAKEIRKTK